MGCADAMFIARPTEDTSFEAWVCCLSLYGPFGMDLRTEQACETYFTRPPQKPRTNRKLRAKFMISRDRSIIS